VSLRGRRTALSVAILGCGLVAVSSAPAEERSADERLARLRSRFATVDGIRVHYKDAGKGRDAVVFVHGWSCDLSFWRFQVPDFEGRAHLILVDLPGHGKSDKPQVAYSPDLFARALDAVLRDAGVEGAVLVGHSNGTPVIRQFYRLFPGRTRALVIVDGGLRPFWKDRAQFDSFVARFRGSDYRAQAGQLIDGMTATTRAELREGIKAIMLSTPQHVMISSFAEIGDARLWEADPIKVPVLMVLAKQPFWSEEYEAFVRGLIPDLDYHVMDGVSHFLMMDKPDAFNALLAGFLKKQGLLK
jgi:pimeloyl-ACP methyl ester carboxylesterase